MITEWQVTRQALPSATPPPRPDPRPHFAAERVVSLADARVLVLGCGSVGGLGAWGLAGAGVGTLVLADRDRLEPGNLRRHVCGPEAIGQPKAAAVGAWLRGRFPTLTTQGHDLCFLDRADELRVLIAYCDAVLVAVDEEGPKHLIDAIARELRKPAAYVGVYGGGWAGEVILSDASTPTPCYACSARALGRVGIPVFPMETGPDYALPTAGVPESDWARADVTSLMPVASFAVRVLVSALKAVRGHEQPLTELTTGGTAWRVLLRNVPGWGEPGQLIRMTTSHTVACPMCSSAGDQMP